MQQHVTIRPVTDADVQAAGWFTTTTSATGGVPVPAVEVKL